MSNNEHIPDDAYILVSQGIVIDWYFLKETALIMAEKSNKRFLDYKQQCLDNGSPYADNAVHVFYNGEMIANEWGEVQK